MSCSTCKARVLNMIVPKSLWEYLFSAAQLTLKIQAACLTEFIWIVFVPCRPPLRTHSSVSTSILKGLSIRFTIDSYASIRETFSGHNTHGCPVLSQGCRNYGLRIKLNFVSRLLPHCRPLRKFLWNTHLVYSFNLLLTYEKGSGLRTVLVKHFCFIRLMACP